MLPFTAEIFFSNFEQYNRALWPLPILAWSLGLAALVAPLRPVLSGDRVIAGLLAAAWLWTGYGYHYQQFASINFAAPIYAIFFMLQGLLLAWTGVLRGRLGFRFDGGLAGWFGLGLALAALFGWPLTDRLTGYGFDAVRLVGTAPAPTTAFTLGVLLLVQGRTPLHLVVIPLLWTLVAGATAWIVWIPQDLALPLAGLAVLALGSWRKHRPAAT